MDSNSTATESTNYPGNKDTNGHCESESMVDKKPFAPKSSIRNSRDSSDNSDFLDKTNDGFTLANAFLQRQRLRGSSSGQEIYMTLSPSRKNVTFVQESDDTSLSTSTPQSEAHISVTKTNNHSDEIHGSPTTSTTREETNFVFCAEFKMSRIRRSSDTVGGSALCRKKVSHPSIRGTIRKINTTPPPLLQRRNSDGYNFKNNEPPPPSRKKTANGSRPPTSGPIRKINTPDPPFLHRRNTYRCNFENNEPPPTMPQPPISPIHKKTTSGLLSPNICSIREINTPPQFLQRRNTDGCNFKTNEPLLPITHIHKIKNSCSKQNTHEPLRPCHLRRRSTSDRTVETTENMPEFDKTYGRCVKHPATLIAIKAPFRKSGWSLIRQNCPLCDNELQKMESKTEDDSNKRNPVHHPDAKPKQISPSRAHVRGNITGHCPDPKSRQLSRSSARMHGSAKNKKQEGNTQRMPEYSRSGPNLHSSMPSLCKKFPHNDTTCYGGSNAPHHGNSFSPPQHANGNVPLDVRRNSVNRKGSRNSNSTQSPIDQRCNNIVSCHNQTLDQNKPGCNDQAPSGHQRHETSHRQTTVVALMSWKSLIGDGEYSGEVNKNGVPEGKGRILFDSGKVYEGYWMDGNPKEIAESLALIQKIYS